MSASQAGVGRSPTLDGLRGAAALAVVQYHFVLLSGLSGRPGAGLIGVLVFFVLSGYLITRGLWRPDGLAPPSYGDFVIRRLRRLLPALLGLVVVAGPLMLAAGPGGGPSAAAAGAIVLTQLTAFFHVAGAFPWEPWLPTWSLSVEWVFYLLWPLLLTALRRRGTSRRGVLRAAMGLGGLLFAASMPLSPLAFYYLPVANLAAMLVGASLALAHAAPGRRTVGRDAGIVDLAALGLLVAVLLPSTGASGSWFYRVTYFPCAIIAAAVIIDQRPGTGGVARRLLQTRAMVALGLSSYSLYLWHVPVLWMAWWGLPGLPIAGRVAVATVVLVPVVWTSYTLLEKPALRPASSRPRSVDVKPTPLSKSGTAGDASVRVG